MNADRDRAESNLLFSSVTVTFIIIPMLLKIIKHWYPKICFQAVKLAHYGTALSPDER